MQTHSARRAMRQNAAVQGAALLVVLAAAVSLRAAAATEPRLEPLPDTTRPIHYRIVVTPDALNMKFSAQETVRFEVRKPTREVVMHSVGLTIEPARLDGRSTAAPEFDTERERVMFRFDELLSPGEHVLELGYSGTITEHGESQGIFRRRFPGPDGVEQSALFTMLCCIDTGRKFAPLWDQTGDKAVFELELVVQPGLDAVSNMPVAGREAQGDGTERVRFQPTPKMSSYLLFFAVGQFEQLRARVGNTDVGIIVRRGMGDRARFPLDATVQVLEYFNDYFAYPFPLPKLDGIGVANAQGFGGMENFGAIAYQEASMVDGPAWSAPAALRDTYVLIAHEVAHQWFGDLVTAQTWDDLWLNEGFADWMEHKASQHFHPQWSLWQRDGGASREDALEFDARQASYPLVPNHSFDDEITYRKGGQVLRMLEAWVGEERFRDAMRAHIRTHAFGNAVTADIWAALDADPRQESVGAIGRDFTQQRGVPLVDVLSTACAPGSDTTHIVLRQGRFGLDAPSRVPQTWHVPVTAVVAGRDSIARQIVSGGSKATMSVAGCGAVKVNAGEQGYFRTRYDAASFAGLMDRFSALSAADQQGLLNDTFSLANGGYVPFEQYLELAQRVPGSADPVVVHALVRSARTLDRYLEGMPAQPLFREQTRRWFGARLADIGWDVRAGEAVNTAILRPQLIELLGQVEDPAVGAEAVRRFTGAKEDPALLPEPIREAVVKVAGMAADDAVFEELVARSAPGTSAVPGATAVATVAAAAPTLEERKLLLGAAAGAHDPAIARRALQTTLDAGIPDEAVAPMLLAVSQTHTDLALDFVAANLSALRPRLGGNAHEWLVPAMAGNGLDAAASRKLAAFAAVHIGPKGRQDVASAQATILFRKDLRSKRLAQVNTWFARAAREN